MVKTTKLWFQPTKMRLEATNMVLWSKETQEISGTRHLRHIHKIAGNKFFMLFTVCYCRWSLDFTLMISNDTLVDLFPCSKHHPKCPKMPRSDMFNTQRRAIEGIDRRESCQLGIGAVKSWGKKHMSTYHLNISQLLVDYTGLQWVIH